MKMNRFFRSTLLLLAVAAGSLTTHAQTANVGIGTITPSSTLEVNGSFAVKIVNSLVGGGASSGIALSNSGFISLSPTYPGDQYYQLPRAQDVPGRVYYIRNNSATTAAMLNVASGGGLISPASASVQLTSYTLSTSGSTKTVIAISDGSNWIIIGNGA